MAQTGGLIASLIEDEIPIENPDAPFVLSAPLRCCVAGSSGSGKTMAVIRCIVLPEAKNGKRYVAPWRSVIWCGPRKSNTQEKLVKAAEIFNETMSGIHDDEGESFHFVDCDDGIPEDQIDEIVENYDGESTLVVFDDLYTLAGADQRKIAGYFTRGRHSNISVVELRQRVYGGNSGVRDVRLNCNCFILADFGQRDEIGRLLRTITVTKNQSERAIRLYEDATAKQWGFLLVDLQVPISSPFHYRRSSLWDGYVPEAGVAVEAKKTQPTTKTLAGPA